MKVALVTGGRNYGDREHVFDVLTEYYPGLVIHGGNRTRTIDRTYCGADYFASAWCNDNDVPQLKAPYQRALGKAGGPIRNDWMVTFANSLVLLPSIEVMVIAFPGGRGTADTIDRAIRKGLTVRKEMQR